MTSTASPRDYSLTGSEPGVAFSPRDWYSTPIPRARMKELLRRSDRAALLNYGIWLTLLVASGTALVLTWGTWWALPAALVYGVLYGSCADSRWHECAHGTVFRTRWLNKVFYQLASFMAFKNPYLWRWSHTRHHTHTIVVGRDPEIAFPRPPAVFAQLLNLFYIRAGWPEAKRMVRLAFGRLTPDEQDFLVQADRPKAFMAARAHLAILALVAGGAVALGSWLPVMLVGLPSFYGSWLHHLLATTQHAGLAEDVPDHRLNSRTVLLNPIFRFVYSNMNFHVEHHMYPMVPFYALPALHEEMKADCPPPYKGVLAAYREMIPAMLRQQQDPSYFVERKLPPGANPTPFYTNTTAMAAE